MLENSWYSVISPEGCAAILWKDAANAPLAAEAMKITAQDSVELDVVDQVIKEPDGGAHLNMQETIANVREAVLENLNELMKIPADKLIAQRIEKYSKMGSWKE
jgi:acetyl-CoA carboxylase carboxyl transferase subunit alpha